MDIKTIKIHEIIPSDVVMNEDTDEYQVIVDDDILIKPDMVLSCGHSLWCVIDENGSKEVGHDFLFSLLKIGVGEEIWFTDLEGDSSIVYVWTKYPAP